MAIWLKQSTAVTELFGPFVDTADGFTAKTALTIAQTDVQLMKNGGTAAQKNDATAATHRIAGHYAVALNATDTGTLGELRAAIAVTGALPVWRDFHVVPANVWDSFFGADRLQVDVEEIGADLITAAVLATDAGTEIANAVKAAVIETQGSYTIQQALSIMLAVLAGVTNTSGAVIRTPNDGATRVTATIDSGNNRTSMALSPST